MVWVRSESHRGRNDPEFLPGPSHWTESLEVDGGKSPFEGREKEKGAHAGPQLQGVWRALQRTTKGIRDLPWKPKSSLRGYSVCLVGVKY